MAFKTALTVYVGVEVTSPLNKKKSLFDWQFCLHHGKHQSYFHTNMSETAK